MFKYSFYNLTFNHLGSFYIYNSLTTAILEIDKTHYDWINNNVLELLAEDVKELFLENGIIVPENSNELASYCYYYDKYRYFERLKMLNITFIPTYDCNLACSYCSQGVKSDSRIFYNDIKIKYIEKFVKKIIDTNDLPIKNIHFDLYGGEPLLAKEQCYEIASLMYKIAKDKRIKISSSITTNAVLLDQNVINNLIKPFNVFVQLTIDGFKNEHNLVRKNKKGKGTYNKTIEVIKLLTENGLKDRIVLRIHINKDNIKKAKDYIAFFRNMTNDLYFSLLHKYKGKNDSIGKTCISLDSCIDYNYDYELTKLILDNNFEYKPSFGKRMPCSLNSENAFVIDPYLNVYKCTLLVDNELHSIGKINEEGNLIFNSNFYAQMQRTPTNLPECYNCKSLPACAGGCAANAYYNNGSINKPFCELNIHSLLNNVKNYIELQNTSIPTFCK